MAELQELPGVGPVLAQRIIDQRETIGGFTVVEDLLDVPGIGERILAGLRDLIVVP
jgi:competence protein ComEA